MSDLVAAAETCHCGASFAGKRKDWQKWVKRHRCPQPESPDRTGAGDSWTQIQTADGRWLFDRGIPEVK